MSESPHLPHGYSVSIFLSFFPSVWFAVMDPLVDEYNRTKVGNVDGEIMKKAVFLTKKFIIKMGIYTTCLFGVSLIML